MPLDAAPDVVEVSHGKILWLACFSRQCISNADCGQQGRSRLAAVGRTLHSRPNLGGPHNRARKPLAAEDIEAASAGLRQDRDTRARVHSVASEESRWAPFRLNDCADVAFPLLRSRVPKPLR